MFQLFRTWMTQRRCNHRYRYSHSKPGTLVCKDCRKRLPKARS